MSQVSEEPRNREKSKGKGLEAGNCWLSSEWGREERRGKGEMRQAGWGEAFLVNSWSTLGTTHIPVADRGADRKNKELQGPLKKKRNLIIMSVNVLEILQHRPCYITQLYYIKLSYSSASAGIPIINAAGLEGLIRKHIHTLMVTTTCTSLIHHSISTRSLGNKMNFKNVFYL